MTTQKLNDKHVRRMKLFERQHLKPVFHALNEQIKPVADQVRREGAQAAMDDLDPIHINHHLAPVIRDIYKDVGLYFANKTIHDINQTVKEVKGSFGFNDEFIKAILHFFAQYLLSEAVLPISQTTYQQILSILSLGISEGWGSEKIASQLESPDLTLWRARLIVRTESNKAMNYGSLLGESKSKWETTKTWSATEDDRTRHSHTVIDGTTLDMTERFMVPRFKSIKKIQLQTGVDFMTGPGDPHASAENVCNCRCRLTFKAKRDGDGRLIPKNNPVDEGVISN